MSITGLGNIMDAFAPKEKVNFLKLADGELINFRIMGEFDETSPEYDPERGLCIVKKVHQSGYNWKKKAECTMATEGKCVACEQFNTPAPWEERREWQAKTQLYLNVLVDGQVFVWNPSKTVTKNLIDIIGMNDAESVSNRVFFMKRSGSGVSDTTYTLGQKGVPDTEPFDYSPYSAVDLEKVVAQVPYDQQAAHFEVPQPSAEFDDRSSEEFDGDDAPWEGSDDDAWGQ